MGFESRRARAGIIWTSIAACCCVAFLLIVFFTLNYPEIRINTEYLPAQCRVQSENIRSYQCCQESYCSCTHCPFYAPSCSSAIANKKPGACCGGYACCHRCCSTCTHCTGSGSNRHCHTSSCNCHCCSSVSEEYCHVTCNTCYTATIDVTYRANGATRSAVLTDSCGTSLSCAQNFVAGHHPNSTYACWYDPDNYGSVVWHRGYSAWKWILFSIPGLSVLSLCMLGTFFLFRAWVIKYQLAIASTLCLWCGVLFPAALFLPILEFGAIKENAKLGLFASAAACLVTGIGAVAYYLCFHTAFLKELMGGSSSSSSGGADTGYPKDDGSLLVDGADGGIGANPAVQPAYAAPQYGADSSGYSQPTYFAQPQYGSSSAAAVDPNAALLMKAPEVTTTDGKYTY